MVKMNVVLLSVLLLSCTAFAAKVAVFVMPMSNSHVLFTIRLAEELAVDHEVVIIRPSINPNSETLVSKNPKVREIRPNSVSVESYRKFEELQKPFIWNDPTISEGFSIGMGYNALVTEMCENMVNDDEFMKTMKAEKFDIALQHHIDMCSIGIIKAAGIPQWGWVVSTPLVRTNLGMLGIPTLTSITPSLLADSGNEMTFKQRLKNFGMEMFMDVLKHVIMGKYTKILRTKFGDDFPELLDLSSEGRFALANVHPDIEFPLPVTSKVTYFGGLGMSNETKPLEEPYASFVGNSKKTVFVSFGTVADPKLMPEQYKAAFVGLFEKNPDINFIWRMSLPVEVPKNVMRGKWHPQSDLLGHEKVVAFITHAGYNSIGESIASGTPLVTVPLFGDQPRNSRLVEYRKLGTRVNKGDLSAESLHEALQTVLNDQTYTNVAREMRSIVFSSPIKAGDALRHSVNFALAHPNYNRDLPNLPFYQLYSLDVIGVLASLFVVVLFIIWRILKCYYWSCCKMSYKEKMN